MKEILRNVSEKGQVTLPLEVRKFLGIEPKGTVAFEMEGDEVKVKSAQSPLEESYQAVPPLKRKISVAQMTEIAHEEQAQEAAAEGA